MVGSLEEDSLFGGGNRAYLDYLALDGVADYPQMSPIPEGGLPSVAATPSEDAPAAIPESADVPASIPELDELSLDSITETPSVTLPFRMERDANGLPIFPSLSDMVDRSPAWVERDANGLPIFPSSRDYMQPLFYTMPELTEPRPGPTIEAAAELPPLDTAPIAEAEIEAVTTAPELAPVEDGRAFTPATLPEIEVRAVRTPRSAGSQPSVDESPVDQAPVIEPEAETAIEPLAKPEIEAVTTAPELPPVGESADLTPVVLPGTDAAVETPEAGALAPVDGEPVDTVPAIEPVPAIAPEVTAAENLEQLQALLASVDQLVDGVSDNDTAALQALLEQARASGLEINAEIEAAITGMGEDSFLTTRASVEGVSAVYEQVQQLVEASERVTIDGEEVPNLDAEAIRVLGQSLLNGLEAGSIVVDRPNVVDDVPVPDASMRAAMDESIQSVRGEISR